MNDNDLIGEYIYYLTSNDILSKNALKDLYKTAIIEDSDIVISNEKLKSIFNPLFFKKSLADEFKYVLSNIKIIFNAKSIFYLEKDLYKHENNLLTNFNVFKTLF